MSEVDLFRQHAHSSFHLDLLFGEIEQESNVRVCRRQIVDQLYFVSPDNPPY